MDLTLGMNMRQYEEYCRTTCRYEILHTIRREARYDLLNHGVSSTFRAATTQAALIQLTAWLSNRAVNSGHQLQGWSLYQLSPKDNSRSLIAEWKAE